MEKITSTDRLGQLMQRRSGNVLSIYYTAGYPSLQDTISIAQTLEKSGADLIEIGMPYSDPVADGPTIQTSNQQALENGMTVEILLEQLESLHGHLQIPVILMGYVNPILQYGVEAFCAACRQRGVDGLIIPDLPVQEYLDRYQSIFTRYDLHNIYLITPQTSDERIRWIDRHSTSFIYAVSDASITGAKSGISDQQIKYFKRLQSLKLEHPYLIGFGISDQQTFATACQYAKGAIIGSAFIRVLSQAKELSTDIGNFVHSVKGVQP
ncbi:MAG: tryptophan synthase alpha chain [Cyclobacteriaceae bacterium]|nr:MAG: tryptophan synthase alpha chain [Cyclobacteriaceae bacterium]